MEMNLENHPSIPEGTLKIIKRNQQEAPVNVFKIVKDLGVSLYVTDEWHDAISGMVYKENNGEFVIVVNTKHHPNRQRFTIAHELGHYLLHREKIGDGLKEDALLRSHSLTNDLEREANKFAADVLMPEHLIGKEIKNLTNEPQSTISGNMIQRLARKFNVSTQAMCIRVLGVPYERDDRSPFVKVYVNEDTSGAQMTLDVLDEKIAWWRSKGHNVRLYDHESEHGGFGYGTPSLRVIIEPPFQSTS